MIDYAASLLGWTRSDFTLEVAYKREQAVALDHTFFSLDAEKHKQFMQMIGSLQPPDAGLARLKDVKAPWDEIS